MSSISIYCDSEDALSGAYTTSTMGSDDPPNLWRMSLTKKNGESEYRYYMHDNTWLGSFYTARVSSSYKNGHVQVNWGSRQGGLLSKLSTFLDG